MALLNEKLLNGFLNKLYPIGKTELFLDNEDHSNYMGFTWQLDSKGRVPVGLDNNDTDFNVIGKTGGTKINKLVPENYFYNNWISMGITGQNLEKHFSNGADFGINTATNSNNNTPVNNLQPYKVFAIWVRIA